MIEKKNIQEYIAHCSLCGAEETASIDTSSESITEAYEERGWAINVTTGECFCPDCCETISRNELVLFPDDEDDGDNKKMPSGWGDVSYDDDDDDWEEEDDGLDEEFDALIVPISTLRRWAIFGSLITSSVAVLALIRKRKSGHK